MLIEIHYRNGSSERRICSEHDTLVATVQQCEAQRGSKIRTIKVVKRNEHQDRQRDTDRRS